MSRLLTVPLFFVIAASLLGAGLTQEVIAAQSETPPPPATETFPALLRYDGLLDIPRLAPEKSPAALDASQAALAPESTAWSRLVFQSLRNQNDWEIYRASGDGANQVNLSNNGAADIHPRLNRGATRVVFASKRDGNYEIYAMNADGSGQARLTTGGADDVNPAWSPDGRRIAFQSYRDGQAEIYVMNASGSDQTRVTNYGDYDGEPAWSPDGTQIAFTRRLDGKYRIWVMNADGGNARQLSGQSSSENPTWSPDGSQIAYDADGNGDGWQDLWLMDASGGNQRQIYDPPESNTDAWARSWSPDGRYIAFTRISFLFYQGNWYWTTAYLEAADSQNLWNVLRLSSNGEDWNPDWQTTDVWAPNSSMQPLPAYSRAAGFDVRWQGNDVGAAGLASYDVQYRMGSASPWTPWVAGTPKTSATFTGAGGQTVAFRARARDAAGNLEAWPASDAADTATTLYAWQLTGRLTDNRGIAIGRAPVDLTPSPLATVQTGADGRYLAYLTAGGNYSIAVDRAGYGSLAVSPVTINRDRLVDYYLPPAHNLISNGGFEAGTPLPSDWILDGSNDMAAISPDAHTGSRALLFGRKCPYPCITERELVAENGPQFPDMAADSQGNLYLMWAGYNDTVPTARLGIRSPAGAWSAPEDLGLRSSNDSQVGIAVDGHDVAHAVWSGPDGLYYRWRAPGSQWSAAQRLVSSGENADVAADHLGGVHVVFYGWSLDGDAWHVQYLERLPSGIWLPPVVLDRGSGYRYPGVAVGPDASVHFIFQQIHQGIFYRWRPQGGAILPAEQLWTGTGTSSWRQNLALGNDGTVHAVFHWGWRNYYTSRPPGGLWSAPEPLSETGTPAIAVDPAGTLHLAGLTGYGPYTLYYRNRSPDGTWGAPLTLGDSNNDGPALTVDLQGRLHIANFLMSPTQGLYYWTSLPAPDTLTVTASQRVTIPADMHRPTLSANYASFGGTSPLSIWVDTGVSTTEVFSAIATPTWQMAHADLTSWAGQQVTVMFKLHQMTGTAYTQVRVDDVTLGEWPTPVITAVDPLYAEAFTPTPLVIHGANFIATPTVRVGPVEAENVTRVDEQTLQATVPATLRPGIHDLWVINPGGAATLFSGAFRSGKITFLPLIQR